MQFVVPLLLGAIAALGQAPHGWWWATVVSFAVFIWLSDLRQTGKRAFGAGFLLGLGYFAVALRWIQEPFQVEADIHGWMAPFALFFLSAGMALFWGAAVFLSHRFGRRIPLALALFLTAAEVARSLVLTGFPWALIGHVWIDTPLAHMAAWGGPHILTCFTMVVAASLAMIARRQWFAAVVPAASLGLFWVLQPVSESVPDGPMVRLVQPNVPQIEKWNPAKRAEHFERMLVFSAAEPRPDLIVWPETAIPVLYDFAGESLTAMADVAAGIPMVFGINRLENARFHNSFVVLGAAPAPLAFYDKTHLVPFGEFIPFGELLAKIGINGFAPSQGGGFTAGNRSGIVDIPGIGQARALICYEGIFAEEITQESRPRFMILITNDAWFGEDAGPFQHLAQARLRAIEQGLPMVRVANTGVSAMIDGHGRILDQIALGEAGYRDIALPPPLPPTVYSRFGDLPFLVLLVIGLGLNSQRRIASAA